MDPNPNPTPIVPGSLVMPGGSEPTPAPVPTPEPTPPPAPTPAPEPVPVPEPKPVAKEPERATTDFSWQASEYIHHAKGFVWYLALAVVIILLVGIAYFTHQWLSIGVFAVMAVAIVVYASKAPRTLTYELSADGITIEGHHYPFSQFRTFAVLPDISWHTIDLEPTQRFMPRLTILFEDDDFDAIVGHLAEHLPRVDRQPDVIERATRYLRF
jgi:hypothetical protein